jgi:hypothetical protein
VGLIDGLLAHRAHVDAADVHGRTPLHLASAMGHVEAVSVLLARGADPTAIDTHANTPIHYASIEARETTLTALVAEERSRPALRARNADDLLPLHMAVSTGDVTTVAVRATDPPSSPPQHRHLTATSPQTLPPPSSLLLHPHPPAPPIFGRCAARSSTSIRSPLSPHRTSSHLWQVLVEADPTLVDLRVRDEGTAIHAAAEKGHTGVLSLRMLTGRVERGS